jgi:F-type H+-transporting ATPase subunit b
MHDLFAAFGIDWKLLLIQAVNFGVLLFILSKYLYRPLMKTIDERRAKIDDGIRKAEAADQRLVEADTEGKGIVAGASKEAQGIVAAARARADEEAGGILKNTHDRVANILADASAQAEEKRRQAILSSEKEIARAAMLAAEKILKEKAA